LHEFDVGFGCVIAYDVRMMPYERLRAWRACDDLTIAVYKVTKTFPRDELYGLTSQARRAAFSAEANMAEGSAKRGPREFRRFLDISLGSLSELATILHVAKRLEYIKLEQWRELDDLRTKASKLTWHLYRSIRESTTAAAAV
jgi:four helix bundle protein